MIITRRRTASESRHGDESAESARLTDARGEAADDDPEPPNSAGHHDPEMAGLQVNVIDKRHTDGNSPHAITVDSQPLADWLNAMTTQAATLVGLTAGQVNVALVHEQAMADLHKRTTGIAGPTDVLTFDLRDDQHDQTTVEGDIAICVDVAFQNAQQRSHDTHVELLLYIVHGLLHLAGEDDHDQHAFARMHEREERVMATLGFPGVFGSIDDAWRRREDMPLKPRRTEPPT